MILKGEDFSVQRRETSELSVVACRKKKHQRQSCCQGFHQHNRCDAGQPEASSGKTSRVAFLQHSSPLPSWQTATSR